MTFLITGTQREDRETDVICKTHPRAYLSTVLVSNWHHNKLPQTNWLKTT